MGLSVNVQISEDAQGRLSPNGDEASSPSFQFTPFFLPPHSLSHPLSSPPHFVPRSGPLNSARGSGRVLWAPPVDLCGARLPNDFCVYYITCMWTNFWVDSVLKCLWRWCYNLLLFNILHSFVIFSVWYSITTVWLHVMQHTVLPRLFCPSVKACFVTRSFVLVFSWEEWLMGVTPFYLKFWAKLILLEHRNADFQSIFARNYLAVTPSERNSVITNRKSTTSFPVSLRWTLYVASKLSKGGWKTQNGRFPSKIALTVRFILRNSVSYRLQLSILLASGNKCWILL